MACPNTGWGKKSKNDNQVDWFIWHLGVGCIENEIYIFIFKGGILIIILVETLKVCSLEHQVSGCFFPAQEVS